MAVNVAFGRRLEGMDDGTGEMRQAMRDELTRGCGPWEAAGANLIDKIIHPADTRKEIIQALRRARGASGEQGRSRRLLAGWPRMF